MSAIRKSAIVKEDETFNVLSTADAGSRTTNGEKTGARPYSQRIYRLTMASSSDEPRRFLELLEGSCLLAQGVEETIWVVQELQGRSVLHQLAALQNHHPEVSTWQRVPIGKGRHFANFISLGDTMVCHTLVCRAAYFWCYMMCW